MRRSPGNGIRITSPHIKENVMTIETREARVRRRLRREGYVLQKSRARNPEVRATQGGYAVIDVYLNALVSHAGPHGFGATLEDVEELAGSLPAQ
jgi:hypothetical protein